MEINIEERNNRYVLTYPGEESAVVICYTLRDALETARGYFENGK